MGDRRMDYNRTQFLDRDVAATGRSKEGFLTVGEDQKRRFGGVGSLVCWWDASLINEDVAGVSREVIVEAGEVAEGGAARNPGRRRKSYGRFRNLRP